MGLEYRGKNDFVLAVGVILKCNSDRELQTLSEVSCREPYATSIPIRFNASVQAPNDVTYGSDAGDVLYQMEHLPLLYSNCLQIEKRFSATRLVNGEPAQEAVETRIGSAGHW